MCWFSCDAIIFCNNFIPLKRRFGKDEQKMKSGFRRKHFSRAWVLDMGNEPLKSQSKISISSFVLKCSSDLPNSSFGEHKPCNMITKDDSNMRWCDVLVFPRCSYFDYLCQSSLCSPKRRFWKEELQMKSGFFEALFNWAWPKSHALETCFENPHSIFCSSFQNQSESLRLGGVIFRSTFQLSMAQISRLTKPMHARPNGRVLFWDDKHDEPTRWHVQYSLTVDRTFLHVCRTQTNHPCI